MEDRSKENGLIKNLSAENGSNLQRTDLQKTDLQRVDQHKTDLQRTDLHITYPTEQTVAGHTLVKHLLTAFLGD